MPLTTVIKSHEDINQLMLQRFLIKNAMKASSPVPEIVVCLSGPNRISWLCSRPSTMKVN